MWDIDIYRQKASRLLVVLLWAFGPLSAAVAYSLGGPWLALGLAGVAVAALATAVWRFGGSPAAERATIAVALMGEISLLLGASAGGPWQVDVHMAYFAGVALVGVYCDPIALIAATAVVALHHLSLNFLLPEAVYPGGSDIVRVLMHAVILLVEAGGLIWMSTIIAGALARASVAGQRAEEALAAARAAAEQTESARQAERREGDQRQSLQLEMDGRQSATAAILAARLSQIAEGDLTARITEALDGQYGAMKTDFNAAIGKLQEAMRAVSERTVSVRSGAGRFAGAAEALSSRSEQQASRLSETVAALDRIGELIKRATDRAYGARDVVAGADADARQSREIVGKAVEAMGAITESSSRIGQIISVIDEISFQTNLLALNAGVEAARAGESGRGFAVVASEVRALAGRSAQAAKEIKELISASMAQVESGAQLVEGTGAALERIAGEVSELNRVVAEIADTAKDQLAGVSEIHRALTEMDGVTQENASMAREATEASRELAAESDDLGELMRQFNVGAALAGPARGVRPPAAKAAPAPAAPPRRKVANGDWSEF